jgi:cystathionine beta-lyase family protein involved in aluminum resistance
MAKLTKIQKAAVEDLVEALRAARSRLCVFAGEPYPHIPGKKEAIMAGVDLCQWELLRDIDNTLARAAKVIP